MMRLSEIRVGGTYEIGFNTILEACRRRVAGSEVDASELARLLCDDDSTVFVTVIAVGEPYKRRLDGVRVRAERFGHRVELLIHPMALDYWLQEGGPLRQMAREERLRELLGQLLDRLS